MLDQGVLLSWTYVDNVIIIYYLDVSDIPTLTNWQLYSLS